MTNKKNPLDELDIKSPSRLMIGKILTDHRGGVIADTLQAHVLQNRRFCDLCEIVAGKLYVHETNIKSETFKKWMRLTCELCGAEWATGDRWNCGRQLKPVTGIVFD